MAAIDELPALITADLNTFPSPANVGNADSLWTTRLAQAQAYWNIKNNAGQWNWAVQLQLDFFTAVVPSDNAVVRAALLKMAARICILADRITSGTASATGN